MSVIRLDCRRLSCPQPVLKVKEFLEQGQEEIEILVDNEGAMQNVSRFAGSRGCKVATEPLADGSFRIVLRGGSVKGSTALTSEDSACVISAEPPQTGLVYVISSDTMGRGDDELGWTLLQMFIQTIKDVPPLPEKILLYNSGVRLVTRESGALTALRDLLERGVEIMACGTCLDFFEMKQEIRIGHISNMYEIMEIMTRASKVISPL
ncbi:MAG: sulfurtransferase-like selenium metabolism protein YedF [Desulfobulbus propionicus]|nr:MAG: sulfurtransferase-like selenium metabolism protein YedF [Desulfobulbus propionicus]